MDARFLAALPVYNEARNLHGVLDRVLAYSPHVLAVDDGSTDATPALLAARGDTRVATHPENRGYGAALVTAFEYAARHDFDVVVTIDADGQHDPALIPKFVAACAGDVDVVSGSRYLKPFPQNTPAPAARRHINRVVTRELNRRLGLRLTDAFCGFKAYRVAALRRLRLTEPGYAMPLEFWVQAARQGLRVRELAVPRVYLDANRSFGSLLDDAATRLEYYRQVLDRSVREAMRQPGETELRVCGAEAE